MTESRYKLHLGDCLEVMRGMEANSVDAIITDLPYQTTACSWDTIIPFEPMWEAVRHVLKPRGAFVTTASQPFTSKLVMSNLDWFKYCWYWDKVVGANFLNLKNRPFKTCEEVIVFSGVADFTFNPIRVYRTESSLKRDPIGKSRIRTKPQEDNLVEYYGNFSRTTPHPIPADGKRHPIDIIRFSTRESGVVYDIKHPTKKPIDLYEYLIRTYTNEGDTVLDFVFGSGTTGVAAMRTGRKFAGIELDPDYFAIAQERIANAAGEIVVTAKERERGMVSLFDWAGEATP